VWAVTELRSLIVRTGNRVICLGEALVDFVSEPPADRITDAQAFVPSFGGSQANIAVGAARFGARSALVGRAGTDPWGEWLRARLEAEGVDVSSFELGEQVATTMAFVALAKDGEPTFSIYGGAKEGFLGGLDEDKLIGDDEPGVLVFGSDASIVEADRDRLAALKSAARRRGWQVLYDPNLRAGRWESETAMLEVARAAMSDVTVVKANATEAAALTDEADPAAAAVALAALGPRQALVTAGDAGSALAGQEGVVRLAAEGVEVVDTTGAGDAVTAVLAAGLAREREATPRLAEVAMRVAARVIAARGALTGLPAAAEARQLLG
jgi:fructokinase